MNQIHNEHDKRVNQRLNSNASRLGIAVHDLADVTPEIKIYQLMTQSTKTGEIMWTPELIKQLRRVSPNAKLYSHAMFKVVIGKGYTIHIFREHYLYLCQQRFHGYVVHIPANMEVNYCIAEIAKLLKSVEKHIRGKVQHMPIVYFEHVPSEYYSVHMREFGIKLNEMIQQERISIPVGLCIDTCHLYVSGISLADAETARNYITDIEETRLPILIHLNDSVGDFGSFIDRHDELGAKIWKDDKSGLKYIKNITHDKILELANSQQSLELLAQL